MTTMEREALASICLLAAMVDGNQTEQERLRLQQSLNQIGGVDPAVFQRVFLRQTTLEDEARKINDPAVKRSCYELAVGVCDCDGVSSPAEREFLAKLASLMGVDAAAARETVKQADDMVDLTLDGVKAGAAGAAVGAGIGAAASSSSAAAPLAGPGVEKQVDDTVLTFSALNAGLELLPQSLATVAIIPLQTKMVYKIGTLYGYKLDSGHIKEFIATVGLGMSGQFVESYARKFLGGLASKYLGKTAGKIVEKTTGPMMTFASTYALGQVAKSYYASGRKLSMTDLQSQFSRKFEEAKGIFASQEGNIRAQASKLDPAKIINMVRGA
ncbi:hypothetical protein LBMAG48_02880 [Phycisphaerae bacterium]|jgi:uncharacterized protein (DUF697 family)/tellurite resistance protein|nr:hypothetical protein LBMAG48_02880 [Phycisphaerae bacterium]